MSIYFSDYEIHCSPSVRQVDDTFCAIFQPSTYGYDEAALIVGGNMVSATRAGYRHGFNEKPSLEQHRL